MLHLVRNISWFSIFDLSMSWEDQVFHGNNLPIVKDLAHTGVFGMVCLYKSNQHITSCGWRNWTHVSGTKVLVL